MRILWHSNWIRACTGYGKQTRQVVTRLKQLGHEVVVSANWGIDGAAVEIDGILHVPGTITVLDHGQYVLPMHVKELKPDATVTLLDLWPLPEDFGKRIEEAGSRFVPWVPIDHDPCPNKVASRLKHATKVIAMCQFGRRKLGERGIQAATIPHGVETQVFKPADRMAVRRKLGFPEDVFLVVMVQANKSYPSRKCFQQQFEGFARFHARHPNTALYLHSWEGTEFGGPNLNALAQACCIRDAVFCQDRYQALMGVPDESLAEVFQAADVTLNATAGEGFGVPIIESLACGVPVIVTDFTSMSELCPEEVGWRVGYTDRFFTALEAYQVWPDPKQIGEALEAALEADREAMRPRCEEFAMQFDAQRLVEDKWVPLLEGLKSGENERGV